MAIFNLFLYFSPEFVKNGYPRIVQKFLYKFSEKRKLKTRFCDKSRRQDEGIDLWNGF